MARIRTIKPEFFTSEDIAGLSIPARLLFVGLWTEADREGRLEDRPRQIKGRLFPHDAIDIDALLDELVRVGVVVRYVVDGRRLLSIPGFIKHQRPHVREAPSTLPAPEHNLGSAEHNLGTPRSRRDPGEITREGKGREGSGKGREGAATPAPHAPALAGSLPRDHVDHGFCGSRFCVKAATVADMARRYGDGGDVAVQTWLQSLNDGLGAHQSAGGPVWVLQQFDAFLVASGRVSAPVSGRMTEAERKRADWEAYKRKVRAESGGVA